MALPPFTLAQMGVLHRDVKPENFLLNGRGPSASIKLSDFGLSCFFRPGEPEMEAVGSPYFVSLRKLYI